MALLNEEFHKVHIIHSLWKKFHTNVNNDGNAQGPHISKQALRKFNDMPTISFKQPWLIRMSLHVLPWVLHRWQGGTLLDTWVIPWVVDKWVGFRTGFQNQISPVHQSKLPFGLDWTGGLTSPPRTYVYMRRTCVYILLHAAYVAHLSTSTRCAHLSLMTYEVISNKVIPNN